MNQPKISWENAIYEDKPFVDEGRRGFVYVASVDRKYLQGAIYSAESLREYWPDADITLFTHSDWLHEVPKDLFNKIVTDTTNGKTGEIEPLPLNKRSKLFALHLIDNYDYVCYLDCDTEIMSADIQNVFSHMNEDTDIMMTKIRGYNGKISKFPGGELTDHCGMFVYKNSREVKTFMKLWWMLWIAQEEGSWTWDTNLYPEKLRPWDQWGFWWLQNQTKYSIIKEYFPDDARWNFVNGYKEDECEGEIVIYHHTIP